MSGLSGPYLVAALVLVVSGAQKVLDPHPAAQAMRDAGLPLSLRRRARAGRGLGLVEAATGLVAVAVPEPWAAAWLAAFYAALAVFVVLLRRRDPAAGCGCFGAATTPPGTAHVALNVVAAAIAATAALTTVPDLFDVLDEGAAVAAPFLALLATGTALALVVPPAWAALAVEVRTARRRAAQREAAA